MILLTNLVEVRLTPVEGRGNAGAQHEWARQPEVRAGGQCMSLSGAGIFCACFMHVSCKFLALTYVAYLLHTYCIEGG
jgi:hypothetical protein